MTQPSQANILAALTAQSSSLRSRPPPTTQLWADIADPKTALTDPAPASKTSSEKAGPSTPRENKTRLYCIREACGSLILLPNVAEYIESSGPIFPPDQNSPFPQPPSNTSIPLWHIPGSPMSFENIGFSRPTSTSSLPPTAPGVGEAKGGGGVKWLICAECDTGPLGWSFEGGTEAWVGAERVRYGVLDKEKEG